MQSIFAKLETLTKSGVIVLLGAVLGASLIPSPATAQTLHPPPPRTTNTDVNILQRTECGWGAPDLGGSFFEFLETNMYMPEKYFLLIRKGSELGAVRFTRLFHGDGHDTGDSTTYESFYQSDGSGSFLSKHIVKRSGEENMRLSLGYEPFSIERGHKEKVQVGPWYFGGLGAGEVQMYLYGTQFEDKYMRPIEYHDPGFEFAATSAQTVGEINAADPRLVWFRYVQKPPDRFDGGQVCFTREISLPVSALPK